MGYVYEVQLYSVFITLISRGHKLIANLTGIKLYMLVISYVNAVVSSEKLENIYTEKKDTH